MASQLEQPEGFEVDVTNLLCRLQRAVQQRGRTRPVTDVVAGDAGVDVDPTELTGRRVGDSARLVEPVPRTVVAAPQQLDVADLAPRPRRQHRVLCG